MTALLKPRVPGEVGLHRLHRPDAVGEQAGRGREGPVGRCRRAIALTGSPDRLVTRKSRTETPAGVAALGPRRAGEQGRVERPGSTA